MEVSALTHTSAPGLGGQTRAPGLGGQTRAPGMGATPLLRLQSDERLIALTRRGQHAAFETLCARYQARLLAFCRHMLSSREDAEDVLQEVFAAAFNAILADERDINVRPWLYRIARNRSLNHLRRASAIGVDSMDVHFADNGMSTGEQVIRRESFRQLLGDVQQLPETQRTALLLREIDALSYEQIAAAMETTVPSVKSLLVRARISLAEAAEARKLSCEEVRLELGEVAEGLVKLSVPARRHVRDCERCRSFRKQLKHNNHALAAILPVSPLLLVKKLVLTKLGSTASAGSAHVAGGAGATVGAGAGTAASAGAGGGAGVAGGVLTAGTGAIATKAVAGLAAAAIVTAGAVAADHATSSRQATPPSPASLPSEHYASAPSAPLVVSEHAQPPSSSTAASFAGARLATHHTSASQAPGVPKLAPQTPAVISRSSAREMHSAELAPAAKPASPKVATTQVQQVTTVTTQLPTAATAPATVANSTGGDQAPTDAPSASSAPTAPAPSSTATVPSEPAGAGTEPTPSAPPAQEAVPGSEKASGTPAPQAGTTGGEGAGTSGDTPSESQGDSGQSSSESAGGS
jgi:RNA polymerase sigma factor (sigma-70 family)